MIEWDKNLMKKLKELELLQPLYSRFKDDILLAIKAVEKGTVFRNGELIIDENKKVLYEEKCDTNITFEVIRDIGESIDPTIKLTIDFSTNYENGKLLVLGITVNMNKSENNRIDFEIFQNATKYSKVLLASSTMDTKSKRTILTQECLNRIWNTKKELGEEIRNKHLSKFMLVLQNSGYTKNFRKEVLNSALEAFKKMEDDDLKGVKPLYRSRTWESEDDKNNK